ncbi:glycosyltransferase BC10 isoform X5 [Manihot esculenta]|uniref:glycosyltransferase BC10 isoform X5 n=1 Tax=Manihot esculenta TaxID=3983 RepID=UPI001CC6A41D|nr:glycosyltransferase BC10 isoform X5 [Manihot esculenta]
MKQRKVTQQQKSHFKWKRKVYAVLFLGFCFGSLLLMQTQYTRILALASLQSRFVQKPKIAFLFIARNRIPLEIVWDAFFKGAESRFSIFVHSRPGFLLNKATTRSEYFLNRQVNDSIQVDWGEASMIEAERILLRHALEDPWNERFVFLSDSCIPLYNFSYTYDYIMSTSTSFVDSFADTKEGRYNPKMSSFIPVHNWRKGSQWVVLTRKHAEIVVNDTSVFPMFQQHCKRRSLPEFWRDQPFLIQLRSIIVYLMNIMYRHYWLTLTIYITRLNIEENGAPAKGNHRHASFLQENSPVLLPFAFLTWYDVR